LFDAYHVPKPLPQQLLPFGRSSDGLEVLTFGSSSFWFCPCLADSPRAQCSLCVIRVLARLRFRSVVISSFGWARFRTVRVYRADSPRVPGGQSVCSSRTVRYSGCGSVGSDSPRVVAGRSAGPTRTVRTGFCSSGLVLRFLFVSFVPRLLGGSFEVV
jgi:hypothetical protein